jgi:3-deoxy-D-manno-octulosonic-acid transferase
MLLVYRIIINIITLISPIIIVIRLFKKKEDPKRFQEKYCFFSKKRTKGNLIWFHGASVGEILSVIPLIEKFEKNKKINQILLTSNTLSSSKIISNFKFKKTIHQFLPIDTNYHTQKFLNYWKPSLATFIDSEIWPNMITNIKKNDTTLILLNGRITDKSFSRWKMFSSSAKTLFQKFDICFSSSYKSKNYLRSLGAKKIRYIGNLKFAQTEKKEVSLNKNLINFFSSKKIWSAASTHKTEEKICAIVHKKLKLKYKNFLTIIIPRHVHRTNEIVNTLKEFNLNIHLHSSKKKINQNTDIYLVDSFGKTKSFFMLCKTVFLGGSLIKHGGQNPLEAARYGCKILHGPNVWNFTEIYSLLSKHKVSDKVVNINQLSSKVYKMLKNKNASKNMQLKIKKIGNKILNSTLNEMNFLINKK